MTRGGWLLLAASLALVATHCSSSGNGADAGSDSDADSDSDLDAGGDAGPDSGTDTDSDTDTGPGDTAVWVAAGYTQSSAVIDGGYVKCWGSGQFGELGYGDDMSDYPDADPSLPSTLPFVEVGGLVADMAAGINLTCALLMDGAAKCWGADGDFGTLGVEVTHSSDTIGKFDVPADHPAIDFGVPILQLDAGGGHVCVVLEGGDVVCWGNDDSGEIGYGGVPGYDMDDPPSSTPVQLGGAAVRISTGTNHTCAVLEGGDVVCWGRGQYGALGYGNQETVGDDEVPADVGPVDLGGPAAQVSCGGYHTCALLESGEVVCWGLGDYGALGYGNTDTIGDDEVPAEVGPVDVGAPVVEITTGDRYVCAVLEEGGVKCWGSSGAGALGYGNEDDIGDDETPADVETVEIGEPIVHIDATYAHTCALAQSGAVYCWGQGAWGQLGYGNEDDIGDNETPADIGPVQFF